MNHGILFYIHFIDDVFLIQWQTPGSHATLVHNFNNFGPLGRQLEWESSGPKMEVSFLDLSLKIVNGRVQACTFEKPMNLHLYIPAFSAHSLNMIKGLIFGMLWCFWLQNSCIEDYICLPELSLNICVQEAITKNSFKWNSLLQLWNWIDHPCKSNVPVPKPKNIHSYMCDSILSKYQERRFKLLFTKT